MSFGPVYFHFNCTIQELKRNNFKSIWDGASSNFNCTIQELKREISALHYPNTGKFQLHHTGIKTRQGGVVQYADQVFQLHHTGIKTYQQEPRDLLC